MSFVLVLFFLQTPSLDSVSPKEREDAIERMTTLGNTNAIPVLTAAYKKEPKADLRAKIMAGLARIGDKSAIPTLADAMRTDLDRDVRLQAIDSVQRLYISVDSPGPLRTIFNKVKSVFSEADRPLISTGVSADPAVTGVLAETMQKDFNDAVRVEAARALGSLRAQDQIPAMVAALEDPRNREHDEVRLEIIRTLGIIRDPVPGPALEKLIRDKDPEIVGESVLSLGLVGYKPARPVIEELYRTSGERQIRRRSLEALSLMRDPGSAALFESLLGNPDDYFRELAAEGLARLHHDPNVLQDRWRQEQKPNVRNALAFGLASSGQNDRINDLANALDSRQEYQVHVYLVELGKFDGKLPELYRYLRSSNPKVRAKMIRVIADVGDKSSVDQIQPLTDDPDVTVVREAVAALRKLTQ
jgi:HEAT repeat protein